MQDKDPVAEYPFTQADLWQRCLDLHVALDRDAADLAKRGVTAQRILKFKSDTAEFGEMEPDTVLKQEGAAVTEDKDAVRTAAGNGHAKRTEHNRHQRRRAYGPV